MLLLLKLFKANDGRKSFQKFSSSLKLLPMQVLYHLSVSDLEVFDFQHRFHLHM